MLRLASRRIRRGELCTERIALTLNQKKLCPKLRFNRRRGFSRLNGHFTQSRLRRNLRGCGESRQQRVSLTLHGVSFSFQILNLFRRE